MSRKHFNSEQLIASWSLLNLTTHRVIHNGDSTMLVHQIDGTRVILTTHPELFVYAGMVVGMGIFIETKLRAFQTATELSYLIAATLAAAYFIFRETSVEIFGAMRTIRCTVTGAAEMALATKFADIVERMACIASRPEATKVDARSET